MRAWSEIIPDLQAALDIERVKTRPQGRDKVPYLEGDDVINTANRIFGEDGWDAFPLSQVQRFEVGTKMTELGPILLFVYHVSYMCRFHGLLEDGTIHTIEKGDIGKNSTQSEAYQQHEMAISGCATDALKRSMRHLGRQFGITLYDTEHEDFLAATGKKAPAKKAPAKKAPAKKAAAKPVVQNGQDSESIRDNKTAPSVDGLTRALSYTIPEALQVMGKTIRLPSSGKTIEAVLDEPLGEDLLTWISGLRQSPAKNPPFVAETEDETKFQLAVSYVLLEKLADKLSEEETATLKERF